MSKRHPIKSYVRKAVFKEYDYTCAFCGKSGLKMSSSRADKRGAIDHIYPINKGGTNDYDNLQLLCTECNARKRDKTMDEFVEYMRRRRETDEMCEYLAGIIPDLEDAIPHYLERYPVMNRYEFLKPLYLKIKNLEERVS